VRPGEHDGDGDRDAAKVERLPPGLLARIEEAVVDLVDASPRRRAAPARRSRRSRR
jgi:hypothetical protein